MSGNPTRAVNKHGDLFSFFFGKEKRKKIERRDGEMRQQRAPRG